MHVLFSETITAPSARAAAQLAVAGHTVHRCHETKDLGLACVALRGEACPLETTPIDVAVTVRPVESVRPQPGDDGVFCAIRRRIPIVVGGEAKTHPFLRFDHHRSHNGDLPEVVARATADLREHSAVATAEARRSAGSEASVVVERRYGGLHVTMRNVSRERRDRTAVRVAGVLRKLDPYAKSIDVTSQ